MLALARFLALKQSREMAAAVWELVLSWLLANPNLWDIGHALTYMLPKVGDLVIGIQFFFDGFMIANRTKRDTLMDELSNLRRCCKSSQAVVEAACQSMVRCPRKPALQECSGLRVLHALQIVQVDFGVIAYCAQTLYPPTALFRQLRYDGVARVLHARSPFFLREWLRLAATNSRLWSLCQMLTEDEWHERILQNPLMLRGCWGVLKALRGGPF
jgi:hypothetical protein